MSPSLDRAAILIGAATAAFSALLVGLTQWGLEEAKRAHGKARDAREEGRKS